MTYRENSVNGRIAFVRFAGGNREIFTINPDGSGLRRVTTNSANDRSPSFSPDGRTIAFTSYRGGRWGIYVMNADGTGERSVTVGGGLIVDSGDALDFSPDGERIVFSGSTGVDADIYSIGVDGVGLAQLTDRPGSEYQPAWSPDGDRIAFITSERKIWIMNADGSGLTQLVPGFAGTQHDPAFSPDGLTIAFQGGVVDQQDLYLVGVDGSGLAALTSTPVHEGNPAFSPDGKKLVFLTSQGGSVGLEVIGIDGSGRAQVTPLGLDIDPDWAPAGPNTLPTASSQSVTLPEDGTRIISLTGSDPDGDPLAFRITNLPANGFLYDGVGPGGHRITAGELPYTVVDPGRRVTYVPVANFNGADNFRFRTRDGIADSNLATVSIARDGGERRPRFSTASATSRTSKARVLAGDLHRLP